MDKKCQKEIYCINRQSYFFKKERKRKEKNKRSAKNRLNNIKLKLRYIYFFNPL